MSYLCPLQMGMEHFILLCIIFYICRLLFLSCVAYTNTAATFDGADGWIGNKLGNMLTLHNLKFSGRQILCWSIPSVC